MKKSFLLIVIITASWSHALLSMEMAETIARPPVELLSEAINKHDANSFAAVADKDSLTEQDWESLKTQNSQSLQKSLDAQGATSQCWDTGDDEDYEYEHIRISSHIDTWIKIRKKNGVVTLAIKELIEEQACLLKEIQAVFEKHNLAQEEPHIISNEVKQ